MKARVLALLIWMVGSLPVDTHASPPAVRELDLVDAGASPRRVLAFAPKPGITHEFELELETVVSMKSKGRTLATRKAPRVVVPLLVEVALVASNGDGTYRFGVEKPRLEADGADDAAVAALAPQLEELAGLQLDVTIAPDGALRSLETRGKNSSSATKLVEQLRLGVNRLVPPLPRQAVGLGARWDVDEVVLVEKEKVEQTASYRLVSIDSAGRMRVAFQLQQRGTGPTPVLGHASGAFELSTDSVLPHRARVEISTEQHAVKEGDRELLVSVQNRLTLKRRLLGTFRP